MQGMDAHGGQIGMILFPDVEIGGNGKGGVEIGPMQRAVHDLFASMNDEGEIFLRVSLAEID